MSAQFIWIGIGFLGQALFSARFLVQWLTSEMRRESVIPVAFWYLSLAGGATLLTYAIWRKDPVFIAGQGFGLLVYARNLILIHRKGRTPREDAATDGDKT
ncbi:lipid-A-disaccharide synthase N-terminal domain-containing protein [Phaeovulum vinaykumarii]|nr:lipid-A-disaccharide synthase N-terminal domain-containing protein [Phaeovulum vinaykumarii]